MNLTKPVLSEPCCRSAAVANAGVETVVLSTRESMLDLAARAEAFRLGGTIRASAAVPMWAKDRNLELARDVERLWNECGCSLGSAAALTFLSAYGVAVLFNYVDVRASGSSIAWHALASFAAGAIAGKLAGIRLAHRRLARRLRRAAAELAEESAMHGS